MKVFISSTYIDLIDHRKVVAEALERMNLSVGRMEVLGANPKEPKVACLSLLDDCDIFVGIYAHRYGFIPEGDDKSITEQEYDYAQQTNKDMFCFIVDEDEPWLPKYIETGINRDKLISFKSRIKTRLTVDFFTKPADLAYKVSTALTGFIVKKHGNENATNKAENIGAPKYFHGSYARTANGDAMCLGWVKPENCDALKLYQSFKPGIDPGNRASFEKVEYYNSIGLQAGVINKGRKHYFRVSAVYENIEGPPSEEICIDTSKIPVDAYKSLSPKLTPTNVAAKQNGNRLFIEWENPSEIELKYIVYLHFDEGDPVRKVSNTTKFTEDTTKYQSDVSMVSVASLLYGNEGYSSNPVKVS